MCQKSPRNRRRRDRQLQRKQVPTPGSPASGDGKALPPGHSGPKDTAAEPAPASYRLQRIEIKRGAAIDQIKFEYSDKSAWFAGHDGGKADRRHVVLTEGEHLVRVTHERFKNYRCAGAAVEFESNKGRVWSFEPQRMTTKRHSERATFRAEPGQEIISLVIRQGVLLGVTQQPLPAAEASAPAAPTAWFVLAALRPKEEEEPQEGDGAVPYRHFHDREEALAAWHEGVPALRAKKGRASVLFDAIAMRQLKTAGDSESVSMCVEAATKAGFFCHSAEENVSMVDAVLTLVKLLACKNDLLNFLLVTALLLASSYLDLYASMLTGTVLTMMSESNGTVLTQNFATRATCVHVLGCDTSSLVEIRRAAVLAFVLVRILERLLYVLNVYVHHNACDSKNKQMRMAVFEHVLSLDQAFFDKHTISEIRGGMNVHSLNNLISWNIPYLVMKTFKMAMVIYFMLSINTTLAAICIVSMLIIKFGVLNPLQRVEENVNKVQSKLTTMNEQIVDDAFNMISSIKLFSKEQRHTDEHSGGVRQFVENLNSRVVLRCSREFGYGNLRVFCFGAVLFYGMTAVEEEGLQPADLTSFFLIFNEFQELFHSFKWHMEVLVREFPDIERFLALMKEEPGMRSGAERVGAVEGDVEFHGVTFEYPTRPGEPILKGLDLKIRARKMTAIVGDSGGGKSTVAKMLMRMYDPQAGRVTLDGKDLRTLDTESLHAKIAIVPQNPELFNSSIADNIAYGAVSEVSQEAVEAAAKLANCHDFISKFRGGYDTFAGSKGGQLSGGQKQRIAIARAAIRDPAILILDEATSALDAENEKQVQAALDNVMQGRTTIVIAHRLSTIVNADEIICMKAGAVVEQGTHAELMARGKGGVYHNLISKQLVGGDSADQLAQH